MTVEAEFWKVFREIMAAVETGRNALATQKVKELYEVYSKDRTKFPNFNFSEDSHGGVEFELRLKS